MITVVDSNPTVKCAIIQGAITTARAEEAIKPNRSGVRGWFKPAG